jgi:predicted  nucleic acid-binding Zn-ribbon protein
MFLRKHNPLLSVIIFRKPAFANYFEEREMKSGTFTMRKLPLLLITALVFFILSGCSTSNQGTVSKLDTNNRADQTFSFNNEENGKNVHWDVNFEDGEISSLYKDGQRIPDSEIDDYRDMIYHRLDKLHRKSHHISVDLSGFKSDMGKFKEDMQKLKEEFKDQKYEFKFDNEDFKKGMEELSKELSKLKDKKIRIDFDSDKFREEMDKVSKEIDVRVNIDMDDLKENLDKMNEEMERHRDEINHITIDLSGLDEAMSHLGENLGHLKINIDGLDTKVNKLNDFIDKLEDEMMKDNLIKDKNGKLDVNLDKNGMEVNGKQVSPELFKKYKKMYEDHFNKKLSDDNHFRIVE